MSKWREEIKTLECGCKAGRSKKGLWFYDFICEKHLSEVQDEKGHFNYEKSLKFTELLQEKIKDLKKEKEKDPLEDLSETELKAYKFILEAEQPLAIRDMPHQLQGAVGKLTSKGVIERFRTKVDVTKHGFTSAKMTNCVKVKK